MAKASMDSARTVPMQVLSLGMPRTGTVSMQAALDILGCGPAYHGYTALHELDKLPEWIAALRAKYHNDGKPFTRQDWDHLLGKYGAVTGSPIVCFAEELINAYPEAKVVLVERDIDSWYQSFEELIKVYYLPIRPILQFLDPQLMGRTAGMFNYVFRDKKGFYRAQTKEELQKNAKIIYREQYQLVRRVCPKERLLEFDLKEGWGPLCEFLGKKRPGPDVPFPRLNERGSLVGGSRDFQKKSMSNVLRSLGYIVALLGVVLLAVAWGRRL